MPSPTLLQAMDRLDQAVSHAEAALARRIAEGHKTSSAKDAAVREALAELDALIASLGGENGHG